MKLTHREVGGVVAVVATVAVVWARPIGLGNGGIVADFTATVVTGGLDTPWDMVWGQDGMIWLSERGGEFRG
jgi:hypothetical protein